MNVSTLLMACPRLVPCMALKGTARFASYERSRTVIYVSKKVTDDSAFPFEPGDELVVIVDPKGKRLILEKA